MAKHLSDIMYNAVNKCITRDIGMGNYEKQGKQKAAYPIPISLPPMPQQFYKDIGRASLCGFQLGPHTSSLSGSSVTMFTGFPASLVTMLCLLSFKQPVL